MKLVKVKALLLSCLLFLAFSVEVFADPIHFTLKAETSSIQAGTPFWVALDLDIEDTWHAYWKNPGEAGTPPQIQWTLPQGFEVEGIEWPYPSRFKVGSMQAYGYSGKTILLAKILPPAHLSEEKIDLKVDLRWVVCDDETCLPGSSEGALALEVTQGAPKAKLDEAAYFEEARGHLPEKIAPLKTRENKSIVESIVQAEGLSKTTLAKAVFFPENRNLEVVVSPHPSHDTQAVLTFQEKEGEELEPLRGVLVAGGKSYAIDLADSVDSAIAYEPLPVRGDAPRIVPANQDSLDSFALALLFAFIGGMILNLMPCVLPVVSLKVLSFVNMAGETTSQRLKHGLFFTLGVLVSFWALSSLLLLLQAWGRSVGWGFQLQEPLFVAILASLMLIFALSLFGVFEMGALLAAWAGKKESQKKEGPLSAFLSGVLATAVATPCTGPFLGSAIGYAFTLPALYSLVIFTSLALGMALPYLILTAYPPLLRFVPRPGKWMETFKQAMGFLMLLATLWLTWVFAGETAEPATILLLGAFFALGLLCWILGKWGTPVSGTVSRLVSGGAALLLLSGAFKVIALASSLTSSDVPSKEIAYSQEGENQVEKQEWEPFSLQRIEALRAKGVPVFVDFTAKWCLICQTNHLVLSKRAVAAKMKEKGVVKMKADWTKNDPEITAELKKWGRSGVPLYLLYGKESAKILPQLLTTESVISSLNELADAH